MSESASATETVHDTATLSSGGATPESGSPPPPPTSGVSNSSPTAATAALEAKVATLQRERDDLTVRLARQAADFDGYMRRTKAEVDQARKLTTVEILRGVAEVIDDLHRALAVGQTGQADASALLAGMKAVNDKFVNLLRRHGVEPIQTVGQPFDPALHEAIAVETTDRVEDGTVVEEFTAGYRFVADNRPLRPARVKTSRAPEPAASQS